MKQLIILALLAAIVASASAQSPSVPQLSAKECGITSQTKYGDMGFMEFDQTLGGGWRAIADRPECRLAAADLIAQYRKTNSDRVLGLDWHEAQVRAEIGQTEKALELFRRWHAREDSQTGDDRSDSNVLKAEATIAFLEGDLNRLRAARAKLVVLPKPDGYDEGIARFKKKYPDLDPPTWPLNLDIVDGMIRCFGKSYSEAYGDAECRKGAAGAKPATP